MLDYEADFGQPDWINERLLSHGSVTIAKTFHFEEKHRLPGGAEDDEPTEHLFRFQLGVLEGQYYRIRGEILGADNDVFLHQSVPINPSTFTASRGIAIFPQISRLVEGDIFIGGDAPNAIPVSEFQSLLRSFPGSTELTHYARSKIARTLREYMQLKSDPEKQFEAFLKGRAKWDKIGNASQLFELELHKYIFIRDQISWMLQHEMEYSEADWQQLMLDFILVLFPKYVRVLREVRVRDYKS